MLDDGEDSFRPADVSRVTVRPYSGSESVRIPNTGQGEQVPIVPCSDDDSGCYVVMTVDDLDVPRAFRLLEITIHVEWDEPDRGWLGVVDSSAAEDCPPDSMGLTKCTEEEIEDFLVAGGSQNKVP